jgi:hypothetical protein
MVFAASQVWASCTWGARYHQTCHHQRAVILSLPDTLLTIIDLRTFSNVWYWFAVAVTWAVVSHWIMGVPFDMIVRARRTGGDALEDLEALFHIHLRRLILIDDYVGPWVVGLACFALSGLAVMGFYYQVELAQGILMIGFPVAVVGVMSMRHARRCQQNPPIPENLTAELLKLRIFVQIIGMISIFLTALYGMYFNLSVPVGF